MNPSFNQLRASVMELFTDNRAILEREDCARFEIVYKRTRNGYVLDLRPWLGGQAVTKE